jgi:DNA transformation protein
MGVSRDFAAYVQELFAPLGVIRVKQMFGGAGVYADDLMFALIHDDALYLRVDAEIEARFREAGSQPFIYKTKDGAEMSLGYWRAPDEVLESPEEAEPWARLSIEAALRKQRAKPKKKK